MSLPTYEQANSGIDVLELVAPYIPLNVLPKCCLVAKKWRSTFMPILWTEPTKVTSSDCDIKSLISMLSCVPGLNFMTAQLMLPEHHMRFLNLIPNVSHETRSLVSTLDFRLSIRPDNQQTRKLGHDEEYPLDVRDSEGKPTSLLYALLDAFPALKFILVDGLDCGVTRSLQKSTQKIMPGSYSSPTRMGMDGRSAPTPKRAGDGDNVAPLYVQRSSAGGVVCPILFGAQRTDLTVSQVMRTKSFHSLLYLDISYLSKTGGFRGLFSHHTYPHLRVLKLRGLHLNDADLEDVLSGLKTNLWSLDVRDNYLTDSTALEIARLALPRWRSAPEVPSALDPAWYQEEPPVYYAIENHANERQEALSDLIKVAYRTDDADGVMRLLHDHPNELQHHGPMTTLGPSVSVTRITGLTNLRISNNKLTSKGVEQILEASQRLQLLDVGTVRQNQGNDLFIEPFRTTITLAPGRLVDLEFLRIHHSLITGIPTASVNRHASNAIHRCETSAANEDFLFNPHSIPVLHHLTLTNVPRFTLGLVIDRIKIFLRHAAVLEDRCRASSRRGPKMKPGLRVLQLEFETISERDAAASVSEDPDADEFMRESETDFSFFDRSTDGGVSEAKKVKGENMRDVVDELKAFRTNGKKDFDMECERVGGQVSLMHVEKHYHWTGILKLII